MTYWGGAIPNQNGENITCACGMTGTCLNHERLCNCDSNDDMMHEDSGWLSVIDDLPVSSVRAGDTGACEDSGWLSVIDDLPVSSVRAGYRCV